MEQEVVERFKRYVRIYTTSEDDSPTSPSTARQFDLARLLASELTELGLESVSVDEHCVVHAVLPATGGSTQTIALLAHLDTAQDSPGEGVEPVEHYLAPDGDEDLRLTGDESVVIPASDLAPYRGQTIITSSGTTLLGADDKAGVAITMTTLSHLAKDSRVKRPRIFVLFTPDEEIGRGTDHVDVEGLLKAGVTCAYTIDGGAVGELESETFNASAAELHVEGVAVHPGYAKDKMTNAAQVAVDFASMLPPAQRPETTEGYEGYIHLREISGTVESATAKFIIRDFDLLKEAVLISKMHSAADRVRAMYPHAKVELVIKRQYLNMRTVLDRHPLSINKAEEAFRKAGLDPKRVPIRGGTDGARLCERGLPCPNIFTGGINFHSKREFVPIPALVKGVEVVYNLCQEWA